MSDVAHTAAGPSALHESDVEYEPLGIAPALELARVITNAATSDLGGGFAHFREDGELADWTLPYDEVFFVLEGRLEVISSGTSASAGSGEVLVIPRGTTVTYRAVAATRAFFVLHPRDWAERASAGANPEAGHDGTDTE